MEHSSTDKSLMQGTSRMMESTLDVNSKSIRSKRSILPQFKGECLGFYTSKAKCDSTMQLFFPTQVANTLVALLNWWATF